MENEKTPCKLEDIIFKPDHYFSIDEGGKTIQSSEHWGHEDEYFCNRCGATFKLASEALEHVGIEVEVSY